MTVGELLDQVAQGAGDTSGEFRANGLRWLNLVRSEVADAALWRSAVVANATITTAAATTSGLYELIEGSQVYEHILSDTIQDTTNSRTITAASYSSLRTADQDRGTTGFPSWWSDAGQSANSRPQIQLWPIPDGSYVLEFAAVKRLVDLTADQEGLDTDPYFGVLSQWGSCMSAGLRFYYEQDNNEAQAAISYQLFQTKIKQRRVRNMVAPVSGFMLRRLRGQQRRPTLIGLLDPSRYPVY